MEGSSVRVRASALKPLQNGQLCWLFGRQVMCSATTRPAVRRCFCSTSTVWRGAGFTWSPRRTCTRAARRPRSAPAEPSSLRRPLLRGCHTPQHARPLAIGDPALHTPPKRIRRSRRRDRSSPVAVTRWPIPTLSPSASMRSSRYRTSEAHRPQRQHRLLSPRQGRPKSTTLRSISMEVGGGSLLLPTPFRKRRGSRDARPRSANAAPAGRGRDGREARDLMALVHPIGHPFAQDRLCIPVWAT
jgi:hypothetical protein